MSEEEKKINLYGKVVKFPKNVKASNAINFLENIKISKKKLWYILIEKDENELQCIKYNNKMGVNLKVFIEQLRDYHKKDSMIYEQMKNLEIDGTQYFSTIKNIPDIEVKPGKKMISFLTEELIQLLKGK